MNAEGVNPFKQVVRNEAYEHMSQVTLALMLTRLRTRDLQLNCQQTSD